MEEIQKLIKDIDLKSNGQFYNEDQVRTLGDKLNVQDIDTLGLICKTIADWCKVEENRVLVLKAKPDLLSPVCKILDQSCTQLDTLQNNQVFCLEQICRLIGNLTYEYDENRQIVLQYQTVFENLMQLLKQSKYKNLKKNSCATLANLASDNETIQLKFFKLGGVTALVEILVDKTLEDDIKLWAINGLNNLVDLEDVQSNVNTDDILKLFNQLKVSLAEDGWIENQFAKELVKLLSLLAANKPLQNRLLQTKGFLNSLFDLMENVGSQRNQIDEIDVEDEDFDAANNISVAPFTADLIQKLSENDQVREHFDQDSILEKMVNIIQTKPPVFTEVNKKNTLKVLDMTKVIRVITRTLAYASLNDNIIAKLIKHSNLFVGLFNSEECEQIVSAAMIIGNLAINQQNCNIILSSNILMIMAETMSKYPNHQPIQHLVLSALRNLTFPNINKNYLAPKELLEPIIANMVVPNQVIQFAAISVLKNFIVSNSDNYLRFKESGGLKPLFDLSNGRVKATIEEDDEPEEKKIEEITEETEKDGDDKKEKKEEKVKDMRVTYETTRILLRFLENIQLFKDDETTKNSIRNEIVRPIFTLLSASFPVLQLEGSKGLSLLLIDNQSTQLLNDNYGDNWFSVVMETLKVSFVPFQQQRQQQQQTTPSTPVQQQLSQQIQQNITFSTELQTNLLNLIYKFSLNETTRNELKGKGIIATLKELKNNQDATNNLKTQIQNILVQLTV
ncbi:armadillo-like helical domain-containing protein [Tieghemostelium lacteum]|uniref:Armadillo-like helical domain-containing protein n=1 Tax=Tieghemostelium lacteum TaxID=361077 RepID=A0A152A9M7_TIELA|nr:armadillo-like helical domain-containing protein [Tieghemostelium lacteum]|eukprot:KYR02831.1 armadillo-like helical domain-containing protein [Tieghemostelium lacteum]